MSEEQIVDTFGRVGQVNNFRLVHDKETGRPKGFGFLEYADPDAAASAVRNLNEHDIMGRKLRVDWSNDNSGGGSGGNRGDGNGSGGQGGADGAQQNQLVGDVQGGQQPSMLPPLPPGADLPAGLTCPDAISKTLSSIPAPQLLDIISQMKGLVMSDPAQATELLRQAPQLAYAIFQALLLLGLVDTSMLGSIVQAANPQSAPYAPSPHVAPPMPPAPPAHYNAPPQSGYAAYPPQFQQPPVATPPIQQTAYAPPPPPQPVAPAAPNQQELLAQVMAMSREQIYQLEPNARQQIIALRAQLGAPVL